MAKQRIINEDLIGMGENPGGFTAQTHNESRGWDWGGASGGYPGGWPGGSDKPYPDTTNGTVPKFPTQKRKSND